MTKITKKDSNMHLYKIQLSQELLLTNRLKRLEFCKQFFDMLNDRELNLEDIFFSDEEYFELTWARK